MFALLLVLWPIAEIFVLIEVAQAIGVLATVLLLIASWPLGTWALRRQGRAAWQRFTHAVSVGRSPGREAIDGALILAGGVLMLVPGFITDLLGISLLLPPGRALLRKLLVRNLQSRVVVRAARATRGRRPPDVDSTAVDVERPRLTP